MKGLAWNKKLEIGMWALISAIILIPLAVKGEMFVAPSFLTFLGLILLTGIGLWVMYLMDGIKQQQLTGRLELFIRVVSFLIGGLFLVSGFVKLQDILGFSYKLDEYWGVFGTEFMKPLSLFLAWFVSVFEIALAFALITGFRMKLTSWPLLGMMVFFTFLTGFSAITGKVTDCGCFGDALKLTPTESFIKDIVLVIALLPIFLKKAHIEPIYKGKLPMILTFGSFALFGAFSYWTYQHLPVMDFRTAYKACQDLDYNWQNSNEEGEVIAHDFMPFGLNCDDPSLSYPKEFQGKTLYIIMYNMDKTDKDGLKQAVELANALKGSDIKVVGATASISDIRNKYISEYGIDFCMSPADETVLKTMVRSNPGYIALENGIVKDKWHHNDTPAKEELQEAFSKTCK